MNNNPLVSIIIPVFNAELYLTKCIESVINQTFDDWELILVNDGSTDKSGLICDRMALIDSRIKIIHKKNEGVGKARNDGIITAKGIYLCFVDSDDWLDKDALKISTSLLKIESFDVIQFGCTRLTRDEKILSIRNPPSKKLNFGYDSKSELVSFFEAGNGFSVWGKLIKKSVIDENELFFGTKKRGEDIDFTIKFYSHIRTIIGISNPLYFYRVLYGVQSKYDEMIIYNHIENYISFYKLFEDLIPDKKVINYFTKLYLLWFVIVIPINIVGVKKISKKEKYIKLKQILSDHEARKLYNKISKHAIINFKFKLFAFVISTKSTFILYLFSKTILFARKKLNLSN